MKHIWQEDVEIGRVKVKYFSAAQLQVLTGYERYYLRVRADWSKRHGVLAVQGQLCRSAAGEEVVVYDLKPALSVITAGRESAIRAVLGTIGNWTHEHYRSLPADDVRTDEEVRRNHMAGLT